MKVPLPAPLVGLLPLAALTTHPDAVTTPLGWPPGWKPATEQLVS